MPGQGAEAHPAIPSHGDMFRAMPKGGIGKLLFRLPQAGSTSSGRSGQVRPSDTLTKGQIQMGELRAGIIPVTPFQQNCTILFDDETKEGVVVDPGGDVDAILAAIRDNGLSIGQIWITHGHIDHAGGAMDLKEALGVDIVGPHADDAPLLANLEAQAQRFGISGSVCNCKPDRFLAEGEAVSFGGHVFEVLHCPGHAPGHVVFYDRVARFAHVGDVLFHGSIGRTDLPGGDHAALISSIKEKLLPLGDDIGFICGHGPGGRFGEERRSNPFLV